MICEALFSLLFSLAAWVPATSPVSAAAPTTPRPPDRAPLDFSGVWQLDEKASRGVPRAMRGAVLSVTQTGNRIRVEPIEPEPPQPSAGGKTPPEGDAGSAPTRLLADQIVADGRAYEKAIGPGGKGIVTAEWGKDGRSLWIEITAGAPGGSQAAVQRSVWKLAENGKVWIRQSVTVREGKTTQTYLVFRKRSA